MSQDYGLSEAQSAAVNLSAGEHPTIEKGITLVSGENLAAGTVLGRITASGKFAAYDADVDPADGTENAVAILALDCDASTGDEKTSAYFHGVFRESALTGIDAAGILALEARGIIIK
jgi:hypothetical protein